MAADDVSSACASSTPSFPGTAPIGRTSASSSAMPGLPFEFHPALPPAGAGVHAVDYYCARWGRRRGAVPASMSATVERHGRVVLHPFASNAGKALARCAATSACPVSRTGETPRTGREPCPAPSTSRTSLTLPAFWPEREPISATTAASLISPPPWAFRPCAVRSDRPGGVGTARTDGQNHPRCRTMTDIRPETVIDALARFRNILSRCAFYCCFLRASSSRLAAADIQTIAGTGQAGFSGDKGRPPPPRSTIPTACASVPTARCISARSAVIAFAAST